MHRTAILLLSTFALLALLGGCTSGGPSGSAPTAPGPAPTGTGYFVGTGPDGVGVSLDLLGNDPVVRLIDAALRAQDGRPGTVDSVGVASIVNQRPLGIALPRFVAELDSGGATPLRRAQDVLRPGAGPAARRALARLRALSTRVPGRGVATAYVVLEGHPPAAVASVRMVVVRGQPIALAARRR